MCTNGLSHQTKIYRTCANKLALCSSFHNIHGFHNFPADQIYCVLLPSTKRLRYSVTQFLDIEHKHYWTSVALYSIVNPCKIRRFILLSDSFRGILARIIEMVHYGRYNFHGACHSGSRSESGQRRFRQYRNKSFPAKTKV